MKEIYDFREISNHIIGDITEYSQSVKFVIYADIAPMEDDRILFKGKIYKCSSVVDITDDEEAQDGFSYSQVELECEDKFDDIVKQKTISTPLTFAELKIGEKFVEFPTDGDDSGHGGFRKGSYIFIKTGHKRAVRIVDGIVDDFITETMEVYKVIF